MNSEDNSYYYPGGIPVGPQARRFGYDFPVYVSENVWKEQCIWVGGVATHKTSTDDRIFRVLQHAYEGMCKKLAVSDDFIAYEFKVWYWDRTRKNSKKQARARLGARLFLHPETNDPWMFIYNPTKDGLNDLKEGSCPEEGAKEGAESED